MKHRIKALFTLSALLMGLWIPAQAEGFYTYEESGDGLKAVLVDDFKTQLGKASGGEYTAGGIIWRTGDPVPNPAPSGMYNGQKVVDFSYLYYKLDSITSLDLSLVDTRYATNLQDMCSNNDSLRVVKLGSMNTALVTNMTGMFSSNPSLTTIEGIERLNTSSVTTFYGMFLNASSLQSLDLSSWNTGNVTTMHRMLDGCTALASVGDLSGWDVSQVTTLRSMFYNCRALTSLNLHGWDTGSVTDMSYMFQDCKAMESLNVRGWNTARATRFFNMFRNMDALTTLDVSDFSFASVRNFNNMFYDCDNLENVYLPAGITITFNNSMFNASPKEVINVPVGWLTTYNNLNLHPGRTRQEYIRENDDADMLVPSDETGIRIELTRSFAADEWTTLCVPFALSNELIKSTFGDGAQVAHFTSYDDTSRVMTFDYVDSIEATQPYLIKPSQAVVDPLFTSVDIVAGAAGKTSPDGTISMQGNYGYKTLASSESLVINSDLTTSAVGEGTTLPGMRACVTMPAAASPVTIVINAAIAGDVNGDGIVDITDVNRTINMVLGKLDKTSAGDVNGSGDVDITDVNAVINLMLGK